MDSDVLWVETRADERMDGLVDLAGGRRRHCCCVRSITRIVFVFRKEFILQYPCNGIHSKKRGRSGDLKESFQCCGPRRRYMT